MNKWIHSKRPSGSWLLTVGEKGWVTRHVYRLFVRTADQAGHVVHCSNLGCRVHSIVYVCVSYVMTKYKYSELLWLCLFNCLAWVSHGDTQMKDHL